MKSQVAFWRCVLGMTIALFTVGMWRVNLVSRDSISLLHSNWTILWAVPFGVILFLFGFSWTKPGESWFNTLLAASDRPTGFVGVLSSIAFAVSLPVMSIVVFYPGYAALARYLSPALGVALRNFVTAIQFISVRALLLWGLALFGMLCVKTTWRKFSWFAALSLSLLANGSLYCLVVDFSQVNNYPFSLGWSEISRYYGASLFFAQRLYGQQVPLPALHPTWHLLLTVPFLFGNLPLWFHRLWQVVLQTLLTLALGIAFTRRLGMRSRLVFWGVIVWAFLYLRQVLITFSLVPAAIIILGWAKPHRFWRTTLLVLLASVWAGLSRINWFPVPGMLAGVLYLFETPFGDSKAWRRYLWRPAVWLFGGTGIAFAVNFLYNVLSGNAVKGGQFASSLTSDLLWYRLLPNATYPIGILAAALLASVPLGLLIFIVLRRRIKTFHPVRLAGILAALLVLLVGGLVVSIKIGGGSDLHNLDAYFVMLMLTAGYLYFQGWAPEFPMEQRVPSSSPVLAFAILMPVWFILQTGGAWFTWNHAMVSQAEESIRARAQQVSQQGGGVLFISQRHLLALKMVNVPLIPADEQDYLMEMVMSHNRAYLDQFQDDLKNQRFAMIVVEPQYDHIYGRNRGFAEENNLWVQDVSQPLLCYYQAADAPGKDLDIALYVPRSQPCR